MDSEINKYEFICQFLEFKYIEGQGKTINIDFDDFSNLFPIEWISNENYEMKIQILREALREKILIQNTEGYQQIIEGIEQAK